MKGGALNWNDNFKLDIMLVAEMELFSFRSEKVEKRGGVK